MINNEDVFGFKGLNVVNSDNSFAQENHQFSNLIINYVRDQRKLLIEGIVENLGNRANPSLYEGSLDITLTVPLVEAIYSDNKE